MRRPTTTGSIPNRSQPPKDNADDLFWRAQFSWESEQRAIRKRDEFFEFARRIQAEVVWCGEQFIERLQEEVESRANEATESAYWAARDVVTV